MRERVPVWAVVGVGLIVLGLAGRWEIQRWMDTRIVHPVEAPISLAVGHIHTKPFRLNLRANYLVYIHPNTDWQWEKAHPNCTPYRNLQTRWVLYQNGTVVDRVDEPVVVPWFSGFTASPGVYELDVEVLTDFRCLDSIPPYLEIVALTENYEAAAFVLRAVLGFGIYVGGILLTFVPLIRFVYSWKRASTNNTIKIFESASRSQDFQWARRLPLRRPMSGPPAFGLIASIIFAILVMMMMILGPVTPKGLWVHLLKPGQVPAKSDQWTKPLIVRLEDAGPGKEPKVFVNSEQVRWDALPGALKRNLSLRREWTVYVQGDDSIAYVNVANVVDTARALHARVFLFTGYPPASRP